MGRAGFADLVGGLVEAMGLSVAAVRPRDELVLLQTPDGFLLAFVDDTSKISLGHVQQLFRDVPDAPSKVVVLTPDRLPLALGTEIAHQGGTLVEGSRFTELAKGLGLGERLGEPPRGKLDERRTRLLPSAKFLDEVLERARTWEGWGVPALALRFYRQAAELKPEYAPARLGIGRSLLALGLPVEADRTFSELLRTHPDDIDARIGRATVLGATGHPAKEIAEYRAMLESHGARSDVRAHLLAALLDARAWPEARAEVEAMLRTMPDDPRLRFLHAVTLERSGRGREAATERERARTLGLSYDSEKALCEHLGMPIPVPPIAEASVPAKTRTPSRPQSPPGRGRRAGARPAARTARPSQRTAGRTRRRR